MGELDESRHKGATVPLCDCGMAMATEVLGDRWSLLIIREAFYGVRRFGVIRDDLNIPKAVLSDRLAKLVAGGILAKQEYQEAGQRKQEEYVLTRKGADLLPTLMALMQWGDVHLKSDGKQSVLLRSKQTGRSLHVAFIDEEGTEVSSLQDVQLTVG